MTQSDRLAEIAQARFLNRVISEREALKRELEEERKAHAKALAERDGVRAYLADTETAVSFLRGRLGDAQVELYQLQDGIKAMLVIPDDEEEVDWICELDELLEGRGRFAHSQSGQAVDTPGQAG